MSAGDSRSDTGAVHSGVGGRPASFRAKWTQGSRVLGCPRWLLLIILVSICAYILQSIKYRRSNFSVFLFDYEFGFNRRGLLGELVSLIPFDIEEFYLFFVFYGIVSVVLYFAVILLFYRGLFERHDKGAVSKVLFCAVILVSPMFIKNSMYDFGRVDQFGFLCLVLFALAPPVAQRVLIVLLPLLLILCHEAQIILAVAPMVAIFLVGAIRERSVFQARTLAPLAISLVLSLGLTVYFLMNGIPGVDHAVMSEYLAAKSVYNTGERSWLLYDNLQANLEIAMNHGWAQRQLAASPLYLLALVLHLPVIVFVYRAYRDTSDLWLKIACAVIVVTVMAQCVVFFLSLDFSRHIGNLFFSFVTMLLALIYRFELGDAVAEHVARHRNIFIAILFVFIPIPQLGLVTP